MRSMATGKNARRAFVAGIESYLPTKVVDNALLAGEGGGWTANDILLKTGVMERRVCSGSEDATELAIKAGERLLGKTCVPKGDIDFLLFCTQSPTTQIPTSACRIHAALGLRNSAGAVDLNQGCSGYVYSLGVAKGLVESGQVENVLLLTADHYSKYLRPTDLATRTLFGDAGTATLLSSKCTNEEQIGPMVYGTDGTGAEFFRLQTVALEPAKNTTAIIPQYIEMNGPEIFNFTLQQVPKLVYDLLERVGMRLNDVDAFVFHQANRYMLEHLRKKIDIPVDKFVYSLEKTGNTVSSSIPLALQQEVAGCGGGEKRVMLVGFGVGLSWAATMVVL